MKSDKPINIWTEDRLNRKTFVKALADEISSSVDKNCNVIGLYGKWGAGKTSIIQLLDEELKSKYYFTTYFNPWRYKSEEILLQELFLKILEGAQSDRTLVSHVEKLGGYLDEYSQYLTIPKINFWGAEIDASETIKGLGKGLGKFLKDKHTFDNTKKDINSVLSNLALPLIIFLDDTDRLETKEVQSIFKLIKLTADFDKLIYIIAFDEEMVAKSLASSYGNGEIRDGKGFLDKIVQLPLRIPHVNNQERFEFTIGLLNEWLKQNDIELPDKYQSSFVRHFRSLHDNFVQTPRDSKRLLNSISFSYRCLKKEISLYDVILLETLRIFTPLVFDQLIAFKAHLYSNPSGQNGYKINTEAGSLAKNFIEKIAEYSQAIESIESTIDFLFPSNNVFNTGWSTYRGEKQEDLFTHQRVGIQKYFDRYIEFKISKDDISDIEFKQILRKINEYDYDQLSLDIKRLSEFPKESIFTLFVYFESQLNDAGRINISLLLTTKEHFFKDTSIEKRFFHRPTEFTLSIINKLNEDTKRKLLERIIFTCERPNHASFILYRYLESGNQQRLSFENESYPKQLLHKFVVYVQNMSIESLFDNVDDEKNDILFNQIEEHGDISQLKRKIYEYIIESPDNALLVMKSLIPMSYYNFSPIGVYGNDISHDRFDTIELYTGRDILLEAILKLYPNLEQTAINSSQIRETTKVEEKIAAQYLLYTKSKN